MTQSGVPARIGGAGAEPRAAGRGAGREVVRARAAVWSVLAGPGTPVVDLARSTRRAAVADRRRGIGGRVVLLDGRPGARVRLQAAARRLDLVIEHEYVVLPTPGAPALVCDDSPAAVRWLQDAVLAVPPGVTTLAPACDVALAVARHALPARWLAALVPGRAAVARAATPADGGSLGREPESPPAAVRPPAPASVVVLATSRDVNAKISVLVIPGPGPDPARVLKIPTTDVAERAVAAERAALADVHATGADVVTRTVPRVLGTPVVTGRVALETTALPGVALQTRYHRWRRSGRPAAVRRDLAAAFGWLAALQEQTAGPAVSVRLLADGLDLILGRWPGDPVAVAVHDRLVPIAAGLAAYRVPGCVVHGDFWAGNVLIRRGRVTGVVDWECAQPHGDPTRDVARLPLSYALYLDRHTRPGRRVAGHPGLVAGPWGAGAEHLLDGTGWFPALAVSHVTAAVTRLGLPAAATRAVLLGGLADIAARADHPDFARGHLVLLHRVLERGGPGRWAG
ncbi:MAG TPA: aminoglycoside phosphotransferase family protein [Kineosporiaceae bacterium]